MNPNEMVHVCKMILFIWEYIRKGNLRRESEGFWERKGYARVYNFYFRILQAYFSSDLR